MGLSVRFLEVLFHEMYAATDSECHCEVQHGDYKKRSKDTAGRTDCVKGKHQFGNADNHDLRRCLDEVCELVSEVRQDVLDGL